MSKVLLIAPTCDGTDVGEAWVAYQWARHLGDEHEVTLLTYNKRGHPRASDQLPGVRVVEWTEPRVLGRFERFNSLLKPGYVPFYFRARRWIRRQLAAGERFDAAHQPLPVATRYPSPAAGLISPLIVGPVGGGLDSPAGFTSDEDSTSWYMRLRNLDAGRLRSDPLLRHTYSTADLVLGIAPYVRDRLTSVPLRRFELMAETALPSLPPEPSRADRKANDPLRLLHVGRTVRTKGLRDTIRAMAELCDLDLSLDVAGDGPDLVACKRLAEELDVANRINFHGRLDREAVDSLYRSADVFVFPSYREPGGNVVFEAMAHCLPLIVCDRGGPGAAVDDECAIRLPADTPEQLAAAVAQAIRDLAGDPVRMSGMGRAARERVAATALWPAKVAILTDLIDELQKP